LASLVGILLGNAALVGILNAVRGVEGWALLAAAFVGLLAASVVGASVWTTLDQLLASRSRARRITAERP
jgi:hypothetical protein